MNRRMYFNTLPEHCSPGNYHLGEHGTDDEHLGKRISDGGYSVIRLKKPDPVVETIRNFVCKEAKGEDSLAMILVDKIYRGDTYASLTSYGEGAIRRPNPYRLDMICIDDEPMVRELRPARIAMRAVDSLIELSRKLDLFLENSSLIAVTDLTPILYETTAKTSKAGVTTSITKLKPEYNVGFAAMDVLANYKAGDATKQAKVTITLGIDSLDRNSFKRIEEDNPKVSLISWMESETIFRYATVVQTDSGVGIWAGVYSNLRVVTNT